MTRIPLSEAAEEDAREIRSYTVERFGLDQARRLGSQFQSTLNALADKPLVGRTNPELDPPGRSFRYFVLMKSVIIVYEPTDDGLRVARFLHGARNLAIELERDAGDDE